MAEETYVLGPNGELVPEKKKAAAPKATASKPAFDPSVRSVMQETPGFASQAMTLGSLAMPEPSGTIIRQAIPKLTGEKPYLNPTLTSIAAGTGAAAIPGPVGKDTVTNFAIQEAAQEAAKFANEYVFDSAKKRSPEEIARTVVDDTKVGLPLQFGIGVAGSLFGRGVKSLTGGPKQAEHLAEAEAFGIRPSAGAIAGEGSLVMAAEHVTRGLPRVQRAPLLQDKIRLAETQSAFDDLLAKSGIQPGSAEATMTKARAFRDSYDAGIEQFAKDQQARIKQALPPNFQISFDKTNTLPEETLKFLKADPETAALVTKMTENGMALPWDDAIRLRTLIGRSTRGVSDQTVRENRQIVYRSLNDDFNKALTGPQLPGEAWQSYQAITKNKYDYLDSLDSLLGPEGSPALLAKLRGAQGKETGALFDSLFKDMPTATRNDIRGGVINRLGMRPDKESGTFIFDPTTFAQNWPTISNEAKSRLFPDIGAKEAMNRFASVVNRQADASKKSSAAALWVNGAVIAALTGTTAYGVASADRSAPEVLGASAIAATSPLLAARMLANPAFARWLGSTASLSSVNAVEAAASRLLTVPLTDEDQRGIAAQIYHDIMGKVGEERGKKSGALEGGAAGAGLAAGSLIRNPEAATKGLKADAKVNLGQPLMQNEPNSDKIMAGPKGEMRGGSTWRSTEKMTRAQLNELFQGKNAAVGSRAAPGGYGGDYFTDLKTKTRRRDILK